MVSFKEYIKRSFMLTGITIVVVNTLFFIMFDYKEDMKLIFGLTILGFWSTAVMEISAYFSGGILLRQTIIEYIVMDISVTGLGFLFGWFDATDWWMSFIYVTPIILVVYILDITKINKEVNDINEELSQQQKGDI